MTFEQERDEIVGRSHRPETRPSLDLVVQSVERGSPDPGLVSGGRHRSLQHQGRIARRIGFGIQFDLAVAQDHAGSHCSIGFGRRRGNSAAPVLVAQPRDGPAGGRNVGHQLIGIAPSTCCGCQVLVFQPEHVTGATGRQMERHTSSQEHVVGAVELDQILRDQVQPRFLRPPEGLDVAQSAMAVLQIGFEPVGDVTG